MARIELRDATIRVRDGLSGTAAAAEQPVVADTEFNVETIALTTDDTDLIPVGARFTLATETGTPIHTVTARTPTGAGPTTNIVFTPALAAASTVYASGDALTFLPIQIDIKVGEGNLTYTENKEYEYLLDRGNLDTVKEGNQVPMDVSLEFVYEFVTTGTGEDVTPIDAIKRKNGAAEWVSSSSDLCEPYCVDIVIDHVPPCGTAQKEITVFADFRADTLEFDLSAATISVTGRCNVTEPTITRETVV